MLVRVTPNAKFNAVTLRDGVVVARVVGRPRDNEANESLEGFLSEFFGRKAFITKGFKGRLKHVVVQGLPDEAALEWIGVHAAGVAELGQMRRTEAPVPRQVP